MRARGRSLALGLVATALTLGVGAAAAPRQLAAQEPGAAPDTPAEPPPRPEPPRRPAAPDGAPQPPQAPPAPEAPQAPAAPPDGPPEPRPAPPTPPPSTEPPGSAPAQSHPDAAPEGDDSAGGSEEPDGPLVDVGSHDGDSDASDVEAVQATVGPAAAVLTPEETAEQAASAQAPVIRYFLERVKVRGNRTRAHVIRSFVPLRDGELFDVDDPTMDRIRWRLLGTGWFDSVELRLARGKQRGWVVLVIEVKERNTLIVSSATAGLARVVTRSGMPDDRLRPYGGIGLTESNLFGLGIGLTASTVVSAEQFGIDLRYNDPMFVGSRFALTGRGFYNSAREFFGVDPLVASSCERQDVVPDPSEPSGEEVEPCDPDVAGRRAVVIYKRGGFGFGTGHDITATLRWSAEWLGEAVVVENMPLAASTLKGDSLTPIDFAIDDGTSLVSSLRFGLLHDSRDDPALPSRGHLLSLNARFATGALGSHYNFARFELNYRGYTRLPWRHVLSFGGYAGTVLGEAPFFYKFYASDLSDLLPSRVLELHLDYRRTHNLLGTSIAEMDKEEIAARADVVYHMPLYRGHGGLRRVQAYAGGGLFLLTNREDLRVAIPGYDGAARVPIDLTFDLGVELDTTVGLFRIGFSTLIGFLPDLGQGEP